MFTQIILLFLIIIFKSLIGASETVSDDKYKPQLRTASAFTGVLFSACSAVFFTDRLYILIAKGGISEKIGYILSIVIIVLVSSFILLLFGEFLPKRISSENNEKTALRLSRFAYAVYILFTPMSALLQICLSPILGIMKINPENTADTITEEEILMMSDAGAENGTIDEDENRIIKNVFAFDDMTAGQICTHRTDVSVLWYADEPDVWEEIIHRTRHSNFPVCGESVDNVIGVLNAKDYFRLDNKDHKNIMENAVHEPFFVHENLKADRLFAQMKKNGADRFAVVVDEYGGMSGIITVTDLVEKLVGEFNDDDDEPSEELILQINENTWSIHGSVTVGEVCEKLDISLPADKYDTFGGYVMSLLGEIPHNSHQASADSDGLHIDILEINHHRIEICRVTKLLQETES